MSVKVASHVIVPSDVVLRLTSTFAGASSTQSDGSEFGSRDGYEHVLSRFDPASAGTSGFTAVESAVILHTICVSVPPNWPGAPVVSWQ